MQSSLRASALTLLGLVVASCASCTTTHVCSLVGCTGSAKIRYSRPVSGAYTLSFGAGAAASVSCPASEGNVKIADGSGTTIACDANGFSLTLGEVSEEDVDAAATFPVTFTLTSAGTTPANGLTVLASLQSASSPNGPGCGPTCATYEATAMLTQ